MKKSALLTAFLFVAGTAFAGGAMAQEKAGPGPEKPGAIGQADEKQQDRLQPDQQKQQQQQAQTGQQSQQNIRSADELEGMAIQNTQGEKLGKLAQVLVDLQAGKIGYAVVSSGGVLGMGESKYIVPFKAIKVGPQNNLILDIPADRLKEAPQGNVEQALNREQGREIHQFYGVSPYWEDSGNQMSQPDQTDLLQQDQIEPKDQKEQKNPQEKKDQGY